MWRVRCSLVLRGFSFVANAITYLSLAVVSSPETKQKYDHFDGVIVVVRTVFRPFFNVFRPFFNTIPFLIGPTIHEAYERNDKTQHILSYLDCRRLYYELALGCTP
jgi:hypothetical protein